ncbi:serine/threonine-protein kinase [Gaopeijia maritima]|uniref:Serine/threonine-protein kinase n=1 Tax=Gaopeijia maritima TaxID=3119007 RepID=A0ABU9ECZ9_9BACT
MTGDDAGTSDRWARLDAHFAEAADLGAEERDAYLDAVRADDPALAAELASMLHWDTSGGGEQLDEAIRGVAEEVLDEREASRAGARIGPYRVVEELGHGGMGTVYLAERDDGAYEARVAIKLIRGGVASRDQIRRFREERQILANLDHPNIARLLDGGTTDDGLPYVVMELVEGEPIDRYCDHHRLSITDRVHLFRSVCDAVSHAHRNLVVHRDLKPGNILVTDDGVPKLLDFGIAKLVEDDGEGATRTALAMTPAYASPEQVRGEPVTTATDVYALGAVLYQLLTGHPAHRFDSRAPGDIQRAICEQGPDRPSTVVTRAPTDDDGTPLVSLADLGEARGTSPERLRHRLEGDLDTIVLMALRKEPERRYGSVDALSRDLANHLLGLPVAARGDAWSYRARRFVSRNRAQVVAGATAVVSLLGFGIYHTARLSDERDRARVEADKAERLAEFLGGLFTIDDRAPAVGAEVTALELLDRGAESISELDDAEVRADLQYTLGRAFTNLGLFDRGTPLLTASEETTRALRGEDDPETAATRSALADNLWERGDYEAADSVLRAALPGFAEYPEQYAATVSSRGRALLRMNRFDEARQAYEEALALYAEIEGDQRERRAAVLNQLGQIDLATDDRAGAEQRLREAIAIQRELDTEGRGTLAATLQTLGSVLVGRREFDEAEALLLEGLALEEPRLGANHPDLAPTLAELSALYRLQGAPERALPYTRRAVEIGRARGEDHSDLAYDLTNLAQVLIDTGDLDEAETTARESMRMSAATDGPASPFLARATLTLAVVLREQGRMTEARTEVDAAVAIAEAALPPGHSFTANLLSNRARIARATGDMATAERDARAAWESYAEAFGETDARTREVAGFLADLYTDADRAAEAAEWNARR